MRHHHSKVFKCICFLPTLHKACPSYDHSINYNHSLVHIKWTSFIFSYKLQTLLCQIAIALFAFSINSHCDTQFVHTNKTRHKSYNNHICFCQITGKHSLPVEVYKRLNYSSLSKVLKNRVQNHGVRELNTKYTFQ